MHLVNPVVVVVVYSPLVGAWWWAKCRAVNHRDLWMVADLAAARHLLGLWDNWKSSTVINVIVLWHTLYAKLQGLNLIFMWAQTCIFMRKQKHMTMTECGNSPSHKHINCLKKEAEQSISSAAASLFVQAHNKDSPTPWAGVTPPGIDCVWDRSNRCHLSLPKDGWLQTHSDSGSENSCTHMWNIQKTCTCGCM